MMTYPAAVLRLPFARRAALVALMIGSVAACTTPPPISPQFPAYVVFFTPFSADLDNGALSVITDASRTAQAAPSRRVIVAGYADRIGTPDTNQTLTKLRAQVVADALAAKGVDRQRIVLQPKGSVGGDPGVESRRVTIEVY